MPKRFGKARAKWERIRSKIVRENKHKPGFIGVSLGLTINSPGGHLRLFGPGALFILPRAKS